MRSSSTNTLSTCALSPPTIPYRPDRLSVGCCVPPSTEGHLNPRPHPSLYFHFSVALFDPPKRRVNVLPHTFSPVVSPYQFPHLPPTLSFGWLLSMLIEWRPPKTSDLSISHVYDACHFGAPNKGISCSKCKPSIRAPAVDS